jgi:2-oxo-4-hydroxy-4-carboxy--5-ureidoimidazoline (OHCU) decarboxylase
MTKQEEQAQIEELIKRYEAQLKLPFVSNVYYKSREKWEESVSSKIKELKSKLNDGRRTKENAQANSR